MEQTFTACIIMPIDQFTLPMDFAALREPPVQPADFSSKIAHVGGQHRIVFDNSASRRFIGGNSPCGHGLAADASDPAL